MAETRKQARKSTSPHCRTSLKDINASCAPPDENEKDMCQACNYCNLKASHSKVTNGDKHAPLSCRNWGNDMVIKEDAIGTEKPLNLIVLLTAMLIGKPFLPVLPADPEDPQDLAHPAAGTHHKETYPPFNCQSLHHLIITSGNCQMKWTTKFKWTLFLELDNNYAGLAETVPQIRLWPDHFLAERVRPIHANRRSKLNERIQSFFLNWLKLHHSMVGLSFHSVIELQSAELPRINDSASMSRYSSGWGPKTPECPPLEVAVFTRYPPTNTNNRGWTIFKVLPRT